MKKATTLSLFGLIFYGFIATATFQCPAAAAVTILDISTAATRISNLLTTIKSASNIITSLVNTSYSDLGQKLKEKNLNSQTISEMEASLNEMKVKSDTLKLYLDITETNAEELFSLLEARADENQTKELRKSMLADIEEKEELFAAKVEAARDVHEQINNSIQKYDDILGYIQVGAGLDKIDDYIGDVDDILYEANKLNRRIQSAVDEGILIINTIQTQQGGGNSKK